MAKKRSIVEKFTDTMKGLADSAAEALKAEEPPRLEGTTATYVPFAAEGLVSDPTLPIAVQPVRKRRVTKKVAGRSAGRRARTSTGKVSRKKTAKRPARARSKAAASASKTSRKTTKRGGGKAARRRNR